MKISDFGLSRTAGTEECNLVGKERQLQFPIRWTAPEVFSKLYVDKKTDVWSFGILFYEFVTAGSVPYAALSNAEVRKQVSVMIITSHLTYPRMITGTGRTSSDTARGMPYVVISTHAAVLDQ